MSRYSIHWTERQWGAKKRVWWLRWLGPKAVMRWQPRFVGFSGTVDDPPKLAISAIPGEPLPGSVYVRQVTEYPLTKSEWSI